MLPSRATSIRSYRILNKAVYALSLTPGALEWASKRREMRKLLPPENEILDLLDKEMEPAIFQISRQLLSPSQQQQENAKETIDKPSKNLALIAVQNAIRRTFLLSHDDLGASKLLLKEIVESSPPDRQFKLKKDFELLLSPSAAPSSSMSAQQKQQLISLIGLHRQKLIFDALRTINSNLWFYSDRFWWRCFPVGAGIVMDKSTRWAQTPRELGDHITNALEHHYVHMKKQEIIQQQFGSSPAESAQPESPPSSQQMTIGRQLLARSNITQQAEKAAGASDPLATAGWRSGNSSTSRQHQRLARSALFRMCFSAAGIHSRVADFTSSNHHASVELEYQKQQQHQEYLRNINNNNNNNSFPKKQEMGPDELQQERLVYHFPKLRQEILMMMSSSSSKNLNHKTSASPASTVKFDPSQAVVAELYLRARRALTFHAFFSRLSSVISRYAPYEDCKYFAALEDASVRPGVDIRVESLLRNLPEPSQVESFSELREVTRRAQEEIFELLEFGSSFEDEEGSKMDSKNDEESILDGDDAANPLVKLRRNAINNSNISQEGDELFLNEPEIMNTSNNINKNVVLTGGARAFYRNENDNPTVEKVLSDLPAEVLTRMVAHIVECCLQYSNEVLVDQKGCANSVNDGESGTTTTKTAPSNDYVRTLLPIFNVTPGVCPSDDWCGCSQDKSKNAQDPCSAIPRLQHRLSLHGVTFVIAGVMARFGIPWRSMKGVPKMEKHFPEDVNLSHPLRLRRRGKPATNSAEASTATVSNNNNNKANVSIQDRRSTYANVIGESEPGERKVSRTRVGSSSNAEHEEEEVRRANIERIQNEQREDETHAESKNVNSNNDDNLVVEDVDDANDVSSYPDRRGYQRMTLEELEEIKELQQEFEQVVAETEAAEKGTNTIPKRHDDDDDDVVNFSNSSDYRQNKYHCISLVEESEQDQQKFMDFVNMKQKEQRKRKILEERALRREEEMHEKLAVASGSDATPLLAGDLFHFATVDIETEQASPPHHIELQLSGVTLTEIPQSLPDSEYDNNNNNNNTDNEELVTGAKIDPEEILAARMLAEKRLLENDGENCGAAEGKPNEKRTNNNNDDAAATSARRRTASTTALTRHRFFPIFINVYRTTPESPIISGNVSAPLHLARATSSALILKYTNIGFQKEMMNSRSNKHNTTNNENEKTTVKNRNSSSILMNENSMPIGGGFSWSKGPRQDPVLGLTSNICHAHLTKCEILAFDEIQGDDERNRHMSLLRDATALWTSVLQLF